MINKYNSTILFLAGIIFLLIRNEKESEIETEVAVEVSTPTFNPPRLKEDLLNAILEERKGLKDRVVFTFSVQKKEEIEIYNYKREVEAYQIECTLENVSKETVCYLSSSCYGEQNFIKYDTAKYFAYIFSCMVSTPIKVLIPPSKTVSFEFSLWKKLEQKQDRELELEFEFLPLPNDFDMNFIGLIENPRFLLRDIHEYIKRLIYSKIRVYL